MAAIQLDGPSRPDAGRSESPAAKPVTPGLRGPFEPANDLAAPADDSQAEPHYRGKLPPAPDVPPGQAPGAAKMEQIKDLYLTAEAIGEDALDKHFQLVSERQRQLIREYFDDPPGTGTDGDRG